MTSKDLYFEHLRLHLWFSGSKFSFHQGKANKEKSELHKRLASEAYVQFVKDSSQ